VEAQGAGVVFAAVLVSMASGLLVLSFFLHITPDASIYLLHARTFMETLNRFALSHDSKGLILTVLLAVPVKLFGATMAAGASAQAVAYLVSAAAIVAILRTRATVALALASLWMTAAFSPLMWGGRVRPEDFGIALSLTALLAAMRNRTGGVMLCGALGALAFFTKSSLALSPLAVGAASCLLRPDWRARSRGAGMLAAGAIGVTAMLLAWILLMDDFGQWFRQTLQWPAEYKRAVGKAGISLESLGNLFALLKCGRLQWLFVGSVAGLAYGWRRGARRMAVLVAALLAAECGRVVIEGEPWNYLIEGTVAPMVLGCAMLGMAATGRIGMRGAVATAVLLIPVLAGTIPDAARAARARIIERQMTPEEALAKRVAPFYRSGESVMVSGQDYQLLLHLDAPRPYPILPLHLHAVSRSEAIAAATFFRRNLPEWIVDSQPELSPVRFRCIGNPDALTYVYIPEESVPVGEEGFKPARFHRGSRDVQSLSRRLLMQNPYRLVVDTGFYQAWRLMP
jgi:hypothetical protein